MEEQREFQRNRDDPDAEGEKGELHFRTLTSEQNAWCVTGCDAHAGWRVGKGLGVPGADNLLAVACRQCPLAAAPRWEAQYVYRMQAIPVETLPADAPWWLWWGLSLSQMRRGGF